jgi:hypothetical protein
MSAYEPSNLYINKLLNHTDHLEIGKQYKWFKKSNGGLPPSFSWVTMLAYDACPVFVIIQSETGKLRCLRQELII